MRVWKYQNVYCLKRSELWGFGNLAPVNGIDLSNLLEWHSGGFNVCGLKRLQTLYRLIDRRSASPPEAAAVEEVYLEKIIFCFPPVPVLTRFTSTHSIRTKSRKRSQFLGYKSLSGCIQLHIYNY